LPVGVATEIRPEAVLIGTVVLIWMLLALLAPAYEALNVTLSFVTTSKFVPLI